MDDVFIKGNATSGYYVAVVSPDNPTVVGQDKDPVEAYQQAISKGYKSPALLYVPEKDSVFIYHAAH